MNGNTEVESTLYVPDVKEIVTMLWRRRALILTIVGIVVAIGLVTLLARSNTYKAVSAVLIEEQNLALTDMADVTAGAKFDDRTVVTEVNILTSPSLALQTIKAIELNKTDEFEGEKPEDAVPAFLAHLDVKPKGTSRVIEVGFKSKDPALAAKIANAHVDSYMKFKIDAKKKRVSDMGVMFQEKVKDLQADVMKKSQEIEAYRAKENLISGKTDQALINEQISNISDKLAPVELHKFDVQSRLEAIEAAEKTGTPDAVTDIVNSPLIQSLKQQRGMVTLQTSTGQLGPNHPKRLAAGGEMGQINAQIKNEIANIKASLKRDAEATIAQEEMLKARLEELKTQVGSEREKSIELDALIAEKDASQKLLDSFLSNYQNIQSQVSFARSDASVISAAITPTSPDGISKKILLIIFAFFGGCLALATVFIIEVMQSGVRNFKDLQRMGQNTLGILPIAEGGNIVPLIARNSSYREAIKRIYMSSMMNSGAKTILVTSALPAEGRTHLVTSMAAYLTSLNHKVVVVDADFLRPSLSGYNIEGGIGLVDVLAGRATLEQALTQDAANGVTILRAGKDAAALPDALRTDKFHQLLNELKSRYAYVLIDSGPLLSHSEASVISTQTDGIIVVVEWMKTSRKNIANMFKMLGQLSTPVLGVVINKVDIDKYKNANSGSDFLLPNIGKI